MVDSPFRTTVKKALFALLDVLGVYVLFRFINRHKTLIVTYHGVVSDVPRNGYRYEYRNCVALGNFEKQIALLSRNYRIVSLAEYVEARQTGRSLAPYCAVITFDDGFRNNATLAAPVLERYNAPATIFLTTGYVDTTKELIWTEKITRLLMETRQEKVRLRLFDETEFRLSSPGDRELASLEIRGFLKQASDYKIQQVTEELEKQLADVDLDACFPKERYEYLTWSEARGLSGGTVTFGSHTENHLVLSTADLQTCRDELKRSKVTIEHKLEQPCRYFSYPNGKPGDFDERHKQLLRNLGYRCALTQIRDLNGSDTDLYELRRVNITEKMDMATFKAYTCGLFPKLKQMFSSL
jgi:peptidoglycan/xylan/chitin deacetylase (PgdA/CDA1 family)